jgi:hypothetical protein
LPQQWADRTGLRPIAGSERPSAILASLSETAGRGPDALQAQKVDPDIGVTAHTVGELRNVTGWPENLAVTTPQERHPESSIKVSKASIATRVSPKP